MKDDKRTILDNKKERAWILGVRALIIQALGLWEDRHNLERTIPPRRERKQPHKPGRIEPG